MKTINLLVYP